MTLKTETRTFRWISNRWGITKFKFRPKPFPVDDETFIVSFADNITDDSGLPGYIDYRYLKIYNTDIIKVDNIHNMFDNVIYLIEEFKNGFSHRFTAVKFLLKRDELKDQRDSRWQPIKIKPNLFFIMNQ